jgi:hypothetical protein
MGQKEFALMGFFYNITFFTGIFMVIFFYPVKGYSIPIICPILLCNKQSLVRKVLKGSNRLIIRDNGGGAEPPNRGIFICKKQLNRVRNQGAYS